MPWDYSLEIGHNYSSTWGVCLLGKGIDDSYNLNYVNHQVFFQLPHPKTFPLRRWKKLWKCAIIWTIYCYMRIHSIVIVWLLFHPIKPLKVGLRKKELFIRIFSTSVRRVKQLRTSKLNFIGWLWCPSLFLCSNISSTFLYSTQNILQFIFSMAHETCSLI